MSGSFLRVVHNSPAAPAADEIWVQKKRVVSDAPEAWFLGCSFMDFSLVCYLKTLPTLAGQGENEMTNKKATQNGVAVFFILLFFVFLCLDCKCKDDLVNHDLITKELYCWACVNYDSYVTFWDSADEQEFILTSVGMVSEYEPSHSIFAQVGGGGLDLSKSSRSEEHTSELQSR